MGNCKTLNYLNPERGGGANSQSASRSIANPTTDYPISTKTAEPDKNIALQPEKHLIVHIHNWI